MDEIKVTVVKYPDRDKLMLRYIDPLTGKQKHKSAKTTIRKDAVKEAGKWEAELREGRYVAPIKITWAAFRERYEDEVLSSLAPKTDGKVSTVFNTVEEIISPKRLSDVTASRLSHYASKMREKTRSEQTIKGHLSHLKAALSWAVRMGMLAKMPTIDMPKRAKGQKVMKGRPITLEEFERMLSKLPEVVAHDAKPPKNRKAPADTPDRKARKAAVVASWEFYLRGLWWSGLRLAESLELYWDRDDKLCVDLSGKHPMLCIPAALEKGNQDRMLAMAPEFATLLLTVPKAERTGPVFSPLAQRVRSPRISLNRAGKTVALLGEKAGIKVNTDQAGKVKHASAHDFRRAFGQRWASKVMPQVLMELMRHESIETTMRYYVGRNAQSTAAVLWESHADQKKLETLKNRTRGNAP